MAMGIGNSSFRVQGEINVTPMIDVLLVLLIIFMLIVPVMPHALNAALPQASLSPRLNPETPIVVQILSDPNGLLRYEINREDVKLSDLSSRLTSILSARADRVMFVKGDEKLDFAAVANVMDIARGAGADHIGLITSRSDL